MQINDFLQKKYDDIVVNTQPRFKLNFGYADFIEILKYQAKIFFLKKKNIPDFNFQITAENEGLIKQIFLYLTADSRFKGNLHKGILLSGSIGTGKTLLLNLLIDILQSFCNVGHFGRISAEKYCEKAKKTDEINDSFFSKPLFIDDIGKEPEIVNNYGTLSKPIKALINRRYENNSLTFATTNYKTDTLERFYGKEVADRLKEMFNDFEILGNSKRK